MAKKRHEEEHAGNHERWLLTYADLITLLMIFFIIMYSMSMVDKKKFQLLAQQLNAVFGGDAVVVLADTGGGGLLKDTPPVRTDASAKSQPTDKNTANAGNGGGSGTGTGSGETQMNAQEAQKQLEQYFKENGLTASAKVYAEERGVVISLSDNFLFKLGSADLNSEALDKMKRIAAPLAQLNNFIRVEGYTDNLPIHTAQFPSNWELASTRALNVAKTLISNGVNPSKISSVSYGEYRPSFPNSTDTDRRRNRKVDIVIVKSALSVSEGGSQATSSAPTGGTVSPANTSTTTAPTTTQ